MSLSVAAQSLEENLQVAEPNIVMRAVEPLPEERDQPVRPLEHPLLQAMAPSELTVRVFSTPAELRALQRKWEHLADGALEPNPFYEPAMVLAVLEQLGDEVPRPEFVALLAPHPSRRKGAVALCGLFPIIRTRVGGATLWQLWKHPYCYTSAPLLLAPAAVPTLAAFLDWMQNSGRLRLGALRFDDLAADGRFRQLLVDELHKRAWPSLVTDAYNRALYRRAASAQAFIEGALSHKRRKDLGRQRGRLEKAGKLAVTQLRGPEELEQWIARFVELEAKGWKGKDGVAVGTRERHRDFFVQMCRDFYAQGRLMMMALELNGVPVAMKLNLFTGEGGFAFKITYDEAYARDSPGVLLELENLEALHARPKLRWVDSCAAPNRFMINHLWPDRREVQTVLVGSASASSSLALALLPFGRWALGQARTLRSRWAGRKGAASQKG